MCRYRKSEADLFLETISQRYERASTLITSKLPFDEGTEILGSKRLPGVLLDSHHPQRPHAGDVRGQPPPQTELLETSVTRAVAPHLVPRPQTAPTSSDVVFLKLPYLGMFKLKY